jgi:ferredoxin like protein
MSVRPIEDRLALNLYNVDSQPHIKIHPEICSDCDFMACVYACPAGCFEDNEGSVAFGYEGCVECGSCRIACDKNGIEWEYPRGSFGVVYEYG